MDEHLDLDFLFSTYLLYEILIFFSSLSSSDKTFTLGLSILRNIGGANLLISQPPIFPVNIINKI